MTSSWYSQQQQSHSATTQSGAMFPSLHVKPPSSGLGVTEEQKEVMNHLERYLIHHSNSRISSNNANPQSVHQMSVNNDSNVVMRARFSGEYPSSTHRPSAIATSDRPSGDIPPHTSQYRQRKPPCMSHATHAQATIRDSPAQKPPRHAQ